MSILCTVDIASNDQRLTSTDEPGPGDADADAMETSITSGREGLPTLKKNQQASVDARKRKFIDIPMV